MAGDSNLVIKLQWQSQNSCFCIPFDRKCCEESETEQNFETGAKQKKFCKKEQVAFFRSLVFWSFRPKLVQNSPSSLLRIIVLMQGYRTVSSKLKSVSVYGSQIESEVGPRLKYGKNGFSEIQEDAIKVNISLYHSTGNDERNPKICRLLKFDAN